MSTQASWFDRLRGRWRLNRSLRIIYHRSYRIDDLAQTARAKGVVPRRGELIIGDLASTGLLKKGDLVRPARASFDDLRLVHSDSYLDRTLDRALVSEVLALPADGFDLDAVLDAQRYAVGGTIKAADLAVDGTVDAAVNLGGGYHHAGEAGGANFCLYNDVAVAVQHLRSGGFRAPIAIVDLDYHSGLATQALFADDASVLTLGISGAGEPIIEGRANEQHTLPADADDESYLALLNRCLQPALKAHGTKLVFYLAGYDLLAGDELGDFSLTPDGLLERDLTVSDCVTGLGAPLVITLCGGYHARSWHCASAYLRYLLTGDKQSEIRQEKPTRSMFSRIAGSFTETDLKGDGESQIATSLNLTMDDLLDSLGEVEETKLLGYYSVHGVELMLERFGVMNRLREFGFHSLEVKIDPSNPNQQAVRIKGRKGRLALTPALLLVELVVSLKRVPTPDTCLIQPAIKGLYVEWLLLQDPSAQFDPTRPQLPGQDHPGLGIGLEMQEMLVQLCKPIECHAVVSKPAHYHNAVLEARNFFYLDPRVQGEFVGLMQTLKGENLATASWSLEWKQVQFADGTTCLYEPRDHLLPVHDGLLAYFLTPTYRQAAEKACAEFLARRPRIIS